MQDEAPVVNFPLIPQIEVQGWFDDLIKNGIEVMPVLKVLVILILFDIVTGFIAAYVQVRSGKGPGLSSKTSHKGIIRKLHMLVYVGAAITFQLVNDDLPWGKVAALFFCLKEMLSITENGARAGLPLPRQLTEALAVMKEQELREERQEKVLEVHVTPEAVPVVVTTESDAIDNAVKETKQAVRQAVHDIRDDLSAVALKNQVADMKAAAKSEPENENS